MPMALVEAMESLFMNSIPTIIQLGVADTQMAHGGLLQQ